MEELKKYRPINTVFMWNSHNKKNHLIILIFYDNLTYVRKETSDMRKIIRMILYILGTLIVLIAVFWICFSYVTNYKKDDM